MTKNHAIVTALQNHQKLYTGAIDQILNIIKNYVKAMKYPSAISIIQRI